MVFYKSRFTSGENKVEVLLCEIVSSSGRPWKAASERLSESSKAKTVKRGARTLKGRVRSTENPCGLRLLPEEPHWTVIRAADTEEGLTQTQPGASTSLK